jgi:hypothetical protein
VEIRRLATAATTRSDTYFSNDAKLDLAELANVWELAEILQTLASSATPKSYAAKKR